MGNIFTYRVMDRGGQVLKGTIEADNINAAAARLKERGYLIKELKARSEVSALLTKKIHLTRVTMKDLALFCRQFSTMLNAGIPVMHGLGILTRQMANPLLREATEEVVRDLERGRTLSDAMAMHPKVFPALMVNMVEAGELGGILDQVFERLAAYYQREYELRSKVVSALIYPAVVCLVAMLVVSILIVFVLPKFAGLFADYGATLPLPTRLLMALSSSVQNYLLLWLAAIAGLILLFIRFLRTDMGRQMWDRFIISVPLFGPLTCKVLTSRFARTLSSLLASGVPVLQAMDMVKKLMDNHYLKQGIAGAQVALREGKSMWEPLQHARVFDPMVPQMIAVGEETGAVDKMLEKIANVYDGEVEQTVNRLTSLIEPVIIVVLALVVGMIVAAVLLPMFEIMQVVK